MWCRRTVRVTYCQRSRAGETPSRLCSTRARRTLDFLFRHGTHALEMHRRFLLLSSFAPSFFPLRRPFSGFSWPCASGTPGPVSMGTRSDEWTCGGVVAGSAVMLQADFWFGSSSRSWSQGLGAVNMLDQRQRRQL